MKYTKIMTCLDANENGPKITNSKCVEEKKENYETSSVLRILQCQHEYCSVPEHHPLKSLN